MTRSHNPPSPASGHLDPSKTSSGCSASASVPCGQAGDGAGGEGDVCYRRPPGGRGEDPGHVDDRERLERHAKNTSRPAIAATNHCALGSASGHLARRAPRPAARARRSHEAGEIPIGYVTLRPGTPVTLEQIRQFVASQVAGYKQIRRLEVIEAIPKSPSGKILRWVLRDAAAAQAGPSRG